MTVRNVQIFFDADRRVRSGDRRSARQCRSEHDGVVKYDGCTFNRLHKLSSRKKFTGFFRYTFRRLPTKWLRPDTVRRALNRNPFVEHGKIIELCAPSVTVCVRYC